MTNQNHNHNPNDSKENFSPDFSVFLEAIALSFEDFLVEINQTIEEVADTFQRELSQEIELFWQDFVVPLIDLEIDGENHLDFTNNFADDSDNWLNPKIEASSTTYPACVGCANYHGRLYNGTPLVCGFHPYGVEGNHCPDWQNQQDDLGR